MIDNLIKEIINKKNPTVVGLDPKIDYLPECLFKKHKGRPAEAILEFNKAIIDNTYDLVPAVKLQVAYYEMLGIPGLKTFIKTADYAKQKGLIVVGDAKRNDIGSTAQAYAEAWLSNDDNPDKFHVDYLTVNGYLGTDGILPFKNLCETNNKGIFVLVKTSNPSSGELQDLEVDNNPIYNHMASLVSTWGASSTGQYGYNKIGAVIGATYPEQGTELRKQMPNTFFLIPGYGAQGGGANDVKGCFDNNGLGGIVNSSRGIMCAWKKSKDYNPCDYALASRAEVIRMRDDINSVISNKYFEL